MAIQVDHAEIKTGQILTMIICVIAFVRNEPGWLIALGTIFLITATARPFSPFVWAYRYVVKPAGLLHSDYRLDNLEAHSFGQLIGALTVLIIMLLFHFDQALAAWVVTGILFLLTLISFFGWCIGCFLYYQINRLRPSGFFRHKPTDADVFTGCRPGKQQKTGDNEFSK